MVLLSERLLLTHDLECSQIRNAKAYKRSNNKNKIITWKNKPIKKSRGLKKTLVKSESDNPKPRENIMNAKDRGKITSVTIPINK